MAERGHEVLVFEAASDPGGQIRLCAKSDRRKDMMGIIDWRMQQCNKKNVKFNFNVLAEKDDVLDEFFRTGKYQPRSSKNTFQTSSPSMDISKASNFERFIFDLLDFLYIP